MPDKSLTTERVLARMDEHRNRIRKMDRMSLVEKLKMIHDEISAIYELIAAAARGENVTDEQIRATGIGLESIKQYSDSVVEGGRELQRVRTSGIAFLADEVGRRIQDESRILERGGNGSKDGLAKRKARDASGGHSSNGTRPVVFWGKRPDQRGKGTAQRSSSERSDEIKLSKSWTPDNDLIERAKETFGVTHDVREAFYVLPDGTMLDGSGSHWGGDERDYAGQRQVDHGGISEVVDDADSAADAMYKWMGRTGAMRVDFSSGVASVARKPTREQLSVLARASRGKFLALSLNTPEGRIVDDTEFESASAAKIQDFFDQALDKAARGVAGAFASRGAKKHVAQPAKVIVSTLEGDLQARVKTSPENPDATALGRCSELLEAGARLVSEGERLLRRNAAEHDALIELRKIKKE